MKAKADTFQLVTALRGHGYSTAAIASALRISERRVRQIVERLRPTPTPFDQLPAALREYINRYRNGNESSAQVQDAT